MMVNNMKSCVICCDCVVQLFSLLRHPNLVTLILSFYAKGQLWNIWLDHLGAFRVKLDFFLLFFFFFFFLLTELEIHQPLFTPILFIVSGAQRHKTYRKLPSK